MSKKQMTIKPLESLAVEHNGEVWIIDYAGTFDRRFTKQSRAQVKANGGRVLWQEARGSEANVQMWQDQNRNYWYGDDWYNDSQAILHPAFHSPF